jgi:hypothetical protein
MMPRPCAPLDANAVSAARASNAANVVFVTFANAAQLDFAMNWHAHVDALHLAGSALMGATDSATAAALSSVGARCFPLESAIGSVEAKWGSPGFAQMGRTKAKLLRTMLTLGATVLFADVDAVFVRDPVPFVVRQLRAGAHLLFHTDGFGSSQEAHRRTPDGLEAPSWGFTPEVLCSTSPEACAHP